ncbi:hypothetical protein THRCLA_11652 [Thraustotheca clavata]|uniref:Transmembrane protein n=1 Tax=Thraustotheca clavata TaxID=74557 RepID=A0A1V9Y717_9STRA|nr:hypothetical protein THRCLA_11652 [Thraustotheca clavata]
MRSRVQRPLQASVRNAIKDKTKAKLAAKKAQAQAACERLQATKNALMMRFTNENSYLNWARNGVLSSGVGVAMYAQEHHRGAHLSGAGLLLLGFGYIGVGSMKYIHYVLRYRALMEMTWPSVIATCSHASIALGIWLTATASFLESIPLEVDILLLEEPFISYLPNRIAQGLIETYNLHQDDDETIDEDEESS